MVCTASAPFRDVSGPVRGSLKKSFDNDFGVFRVFFWEEVATLHRLSLRVWSPLPPNADRTSVASVELVERATLSPKMQHRAVDSPGCFLVSAIMFDIDRCRGSILFTDAVHAGWVAIGCKVFFADLRPKGTAPEGILEDGPGGAEQIALRERLLLREQNPGPVGASEACVVRFQASRIGMTSNTARRSTFIGWSSAMR